MDLRRFLTDEPVLARPPSTLYQVRKLVRRHRGVVIASAVVAGALVSILALSLTYGWRERAHALRLRRDLAQQHLVRGQNLCRQGDVPRGLHWLAQALEETPENQPDLLATIRQNLGSWRGRVQVPLAAFPHEGTARIVDFSADGSLLLTGGEDQTVRLWRSGTGEPVSPPLRHEGAVLLGRFSPDGRQLLTASHDGTARVWTFPEPFAGSKAQVRSWVEALTGQAMDPYGALSWLDAATWRLRKEENRQRW